MQKDLVIFYKNCSSFVFSLFVEVPLYLNDLKQAESSYTETIFLAPLAANASKMV